MSSGIWDTDALLEQMRQAQLEAAQKAFDEAKVVASSELSKTIADDLQMTYEMSVAAWYRSYIPYMYNRTYQLYRLLDIQDDSSGGNINVRWEINGEGLRYRSWGSGSFDPWTQIFLVGFHGGWIPTRANNVGRPVEGAAEIMDGYRWPVQSTPIPELFEQSKAELESEYSSRLLAILSRETMSRYDRYYHA